MKNILIVTRPDDIHAILTSLAIKKKGHLSVPWFTADFPYQQKHSFELIDKQISWHALGVNFKIDNDQFDVVWHRRPQKPLLSEKVHPDDRENAQKESEVLYHTFWEVIAPEAIWVNPPDKARSSNSKLLQLKCANEVGLKIPNFIISNDAQRIKFFLKENKLKGVIYKTLYPLSWHQEDGLRSSYTTELKWDTIPSDFVLEMLPGIFQEKIQKAYELRVTYFGKYPIAVKINSQGHPKGRIDWREIPGEELTLSEYELPHDIHNRCKALMKKLGLAFGCFDFIVTPDNEYYFLEVNETGQFLWIEHINPSIKMLNTFTEFLIEGLEFKKPGKSSDIVSLSDFHEEAQSMMQENMKIHFNSEL